MFHCCLRAGNPTPTAPSSTTGPVGRSRSELHGLVAVEQRDGEALSLAATPSTWMVQRPRPRNGEGVVAQRCWCPSWPFPAPGRRPDRSPRSPATVAVFPVRGQGASRAERLACGWVLLVTARPARPPLQNRHLVVGQRRRGRRRHARATDARSQQHLGDGQDAGPRARAMGDVPDMKAAELQICR